jgi:hypothetical protein
MLQRSFDRFLAEITEERRPLRFSLFPLLFHAEVAEEQRPLRFLCFLCHPANPA